MKIEVSKRRWTRKRSVEQASLDKQSRLDEQATSRVNETERASDQIELSKLNEQGITRANETKNEQAINWVNEAGWAIEAEGASDLSIIRGCKRKRSVDHTRLDEQAISRANRAGRASDLTSNRGWTGKRSVDQSRLDGQVICRSIEARRASDLSSQRSWTSKRSVETTSLDNEAISETNEAGRSSNLRTIEIGRACDQPSNFSFFLSSIPLYFSLCTPTCHFCTLDLLIASLINIPAPFLVSLIMLWSW